MTSACSTASYPICTSVTARSASSFLWSDRLNQPPGHIRWHLLPVSAFPAIFLTDVFARVLTSRAETSPFLPCCFSSGEDRSTNNFFSMHDCYKSDQFHLRFSWRKWPSGYNIQTHPPSTLETGSWYVDQVSHKFVVSPCLFLLLVCATILGLNSTFAKDALLPVCQGWVALFLCSGF